MGNRANGRDEETGIRIGVDLGGSKIEIVAIDGTGFLLGRARVAPPSKLRGLRRRDH